MKESVSKDTIKTVLTNAQLKQLMDTTTSASVRSACSIALSYCACNICERAIAEARASAAKSYNMLFGGNL